MVRVIEDLQRREAALYQVLRDWPEVPCVVIGGYAVSAWTFPRYSHDIDIVMPLSHVEEVRQHLYDYGLRVDRERREIEQNYGASWERWVGGPEKVTVDLIIDSIQDREFQIPIPFERLWRHHEVREMRGLEQSGIMMPVLAVEGLMALKCQPMRKRDIGDLCCLSYVDHETDGVRDWLTPLLRDRLDLFQERVRTLRAVVEPPPVGLQRVLGPRIAGYARMRQDIDRRVFAMIDRFERWAKQSGGGR